MKALDQRSTWIEINKNALLHNVRTLKEILPIGCKAMFVVKSNAYGHGLLQVLSILKTEKAVDAFGVFSFEDALLVKSKTKKKVIVLQTFDTNWVAVASKRNIELTISHFDQLEYLRKKKLSQKLKIHLKVDTGLGRQGFLKKDIEAVSLLISQMKNITLVGLYTHLSGAESKEFDSYTIQQYKELLAWKVSLNALGLYPEVHTSATSGVIRKSDLACNMVRFGIGMYGLWPSTETKNRKTHLLPVLSFKTKVVEAKILPAGSYVAYDCTCELKKKTMIAVLPIGYWDGLPRQASSRAKVLIRGKECPILGRVMMNMCVVDASLANGVTKGDIVTIIGKDGNHEITAEDLAIASQTINYEIITRINPLLSRKIV